MRMCSFGRPAIKFIGGYIRAHCTERYHLSPAIVRLREPMRKILQREWFGKMPVQKGILGRLFALCVVSLEAAHSNERSRNRRRGGVGWPYPAMERVR